MSGLTPNQERAAAQVRASVWNDGKRRVTVARRSSFWNGHQMIVKLPSEVIADEHTIALLESHGIELIDLDVNGRPTLTKAQKKQMDAERIARAEELAKALGIPAALLQDALDRGGHDRTSAVVNALQSAATRDLKRELEEAKERIAALTDERDAAVAIAETAKVPAPKAVEPAPAPGAPSNSALSGE